MATASEQISFEPVCNVLSTSRDSFAVALLLGEQFVAHCFLQGPQVPLVFALLLQQRLFGNARRGVATALLVSAATIALLLFCEATRAGRSG